MPEIVEVQLNSMFINYVSKKGSLIKSLSFSPSSKNKILSLNNFPLSFKSESRGKELAIDFFKDGIFEKRFLFALGMSGNFSLSKNIDKHYMMYFQLENELYLGFHDIRRYGKWKLVDTQEWSKNRGPDPIKESNEFIVNILSNLKSKKFEKPIYEVMMDQRYFSGIGNYLRCIILYRIGDDFNKPAKDYIHDNSEKFFKTIKDVIEESYTLQVTGQITNSWYYPYGQGKSFKDSNGRRFWHQ